MRKLTAVTGLLVLVGCTTTVDEMSYSEFKEYAGQMVEKCREQGVPAQEIEACAKQEMRADQSRRIKQRQIANSTTYCQSFGSSVVCY